MSALSALIVVHNEEAILRDCLSRLCFADEIVVVLDRCTDKSAEIAAEFGAVCVAGGWPLEGERRRVGIDACTGPWILEVDADEWIEPTLADEVRSVVTADAADFHFIPMHNHVGGRLISNGWMAAMAPNSKGSLFRKGHKTWGMQRVHPGVAFNGRRGASLRGGIRHHFADDISALIRRFDRNTSLHAEDLATGTMQNGSGVLARKAVSRFWKCYVHRDGWREGGVGLVVAILCALYPLCSSLKAEEIRARSKSG